MVEADPAALKRRAEALHAMLGESARGQCRVTPHAGRAGGGTLPDVELPGWALRVDPAHGSVGELESALRAGEPPIISRVSDDAIWIDVRAFLPGDDEIVAGRLDMLFAN
jgi:L-seryl-tRNA(Ser) seleniumtransferase